MPHTESKRTGRIVQLLLGVVALLVVVVFLQTGFRYSFASANRNARGAALVMIDVNPGGTKAINLGSPGYLPVAILGADGFDVALIQPSTLSFAGALITKTSASTRPGNVYEKGRKTGETRFDIVLQDVDNDGRMDLVASFPIAFFKDLSAGTDRAVLRGQLLDGSLIEGSQTVQVTGESPIKSGGGSNGPAGIGFCDATPIVFSADDPGSGDAASSSSNITVTALTGVVTDLTVMLNGVSHTFPDDLEILLVAPNGQTMVLDNSAFDGTDAIAQNLTFSDSAARYAPEDAPLVTGTYRPVSYFAQSSFGAPAPDVTTAAPYATTFRALNGINPNGTWSLYARDVVAGDAGFISGGWCINITTGTPGGPACTITCPANITQSNDPNQCGALTSYPAPTTTGTCGTVTCSPASGSFFPVGTTIVTCSSTAPAGLCAPQTITQSTSQAITPLNSVSCNDGTGHTNNSYWRAFTLSSFGISGAFDVSSVDIGVEDAISAGAGQPITVNLYTSSMPFPAGFPGSLTLIGTVNTMIADQSGTVLNIPVTGTAAPGSQLVVEVFTPDGTAAGNLFFFGSNSAAESGPSYLSAADCGINTPTTTAAIGFPDMHIVMNVTGCDAGSAGCTFTVTINDTQPPSITCPPNSTVIGGGGGTVVTFPPPTASDNCPGVTAACIPPSGSTLPMGSTTVTCTATDASGNTATCSFTVAVFDVCLQDTSNPTRVLLINSVSGEYRFCCNGTVFTGTGKVNRKGDVVTLEHSTSSRRVTGRAVGGGKGSGSLQVPPGTTICTISDSTAGSGTCACP